MPAFDAQQREVKAAARSARSVELAGELGRLVETLERRLPADAKVRGVSAYATRQGVRWRMAVPGLGGRVTTRRGDESSRAACAARDRFVEVGSLAADAPKRAYVSDGALEYLEIHGCRRLLPHLAHVHIGQISAVDIRAWMAAMAEQQRAGQLSAKTINNARAALSSALNDALRGGRLHRHSRSHVTSSPTCASQRSTPASAPARPLPATRRTADRLRRPHLRSAPNLARLADGRVDWARRRDASSRGAHASG